MKFLNKKERVMDIQLTQYGKYLLSKGTFRPIYYAFFDDDVIYDRKYAAPNSNDDTGDRDGSTWAKEPQNEIEDRIKEDLRLETQYVFTGIEESLSYQHQFITEDTELYRDPLGGDADIEGSFSNFGSDPEMQQAMQGGRQRPETRIDPTIQQSPTKFYNTSNTIGSADLGTNKKSAWSVNVLQGRITSSYTYKVEGDNKIVNIPQLNMVPITYKSEVQREDYVDKEAWEDSYTSTPFDDGTHIRIYEDSIVLEIDEVNTPFENDNFDVEVFEVTTGSVNRAGAIEEHLIPLYFKKPPIYVRDNVLLDVPEANYDYSIDQSFVEYFFDVSVDNEIDPRTLCKLFPEDKAQGIFSSRMLDCQDIAKQDKEDTRDYYRSDVTEDDLEDC